MKNNRHLLLSPDALTYILLNERTHRAYRVLQLAGLSYDIVSLEKATVKLSHLDIWFSTFS